MAEPVIEPKPYVWAGQQEVLDAQGNVIGYRVLPGSVAGEVPAGSYVDPATMGYFLGAGGRGGLPPGARMERYYESRGGFYVNTPVYAPGTFKPIPEGATFREVVTVGPPAVSASYHVDEAAGKNIYNPYSPYVYDDQGRRQANPQWYAAESMTRGENEGKNPFSAGSAEYSAYENQKSEFQQRKAQINTPGYDPMMQSDYAMTDAARRQRLAGGSVMKYRTDEGLAYAGTRGETREVWARGGQLRDVMGLNPYKGGTPEWEDYQNKMIARQNKIDWVTPAWELRPGYTKQEPGGEFRQFEDPFDIAQYAEGKRQGAKSWKDQLYYSYVRDQFAGQNTIERMSWEHHYKLDTGIAQPPNTYENAGDYALVFLKGSQEVYKGQLGLVNPGVKDMLGLVPPEGSQGYTWSQARRNELISRTDAATGLPLPFTSRNAPIPQWDFSPAIEKVRQSTKEWGPYGALAGGPYYKGAKSSMGAAAAPTPSAIDTASPMWMFAPETITGAAKSDQFFTQLTKEQADVEQLFAYGKQKGLFTAKGEIDTTTKEGAEFYTSYQKEYGEYQTVLSGGLKSGLVTMEGDQIKGRYPKLSDVGIAQGEYVKGQIQTGQQLGEMGKAELPKASWLGVIPVFGGMIEAGAGLVGYTPPRDIPGYETPIMFVPEGGATKLTKDWFTPTYAPGATLYESKGGVISGDQPTTKFDDWWAGANKPYREFFEARTPEPFTSAEIYAGAERKSGLFKSYGPLVDMGVVSKDTPGIKGLANIAEQYYGRVRKYPLEGVVAAGATVLTIGGIDVLGAAGTAAVPSIVEAAPVWGPRVAATGSALFSAGKIAIGGLYVASKGAQATNNFDFGNLTEEEFTTNLGEMGPELTGVVVGAGTYGTAKAAVAKAPAAISKGAGWFGTKMVAAKGNFYEAFTGKPSAILETVKIRQMYVEENPLAPSGRAVRIEQTAIEQQYARSWYKPSFMEPKEVGKPSIIKTTTIGDIESYGYALTGEAPKIGEMFAQEYEVSRASKGIPTKTGKIIIGTDFIFEPGQKYLLEGTRSLSNKQFKSTGGISEYPIWEEITPITGEKVTYGGFFEQKITAPESIFKGYSMKKIFGGTVEEGFTLRNVFEKGEISTPQEQIGSMRIKPIRDISPFILGIEKQVTVPGGSKQMMYVGEEVWPMEPQGIFKESITRTFTEDMFMGKKGAKGQPTYRLDLGRMKATEMREGPGITGEWDQPISSTSKRINDMLGTRTGKGGKVQVGGLQTDIQGMWDRMVIAKDLGVEISRKAPSKGGSGGATRGRAPSGPAWMQTPLSDTFSKTSGRAVVAREQARTTTAAKDAQFNNLIKSMGYGTRGGGSAKLKSTESELRSFSYSPQRMKMIEEEDVYISNAARSIIRQATGMRQEKRQDIGQMGRNVFSAVNINQRYSIDQKSNQANLSIPLQAILPRSKQGITQVQRLGQTSVQKQGQRQTQQQMIKQVQKQMGFQQMRPPTWKPTPPTKLPPGIPLGGGLGGWGGAPRRSGRSYYAYGEVFSVPDILGGFGRRGGKRKKKGGLFDDFL
ncbi:MAG: hypothetical protein OS112_05180 [Methanoregula sp.]|nr:MAG: hypothetical protein OS112_05180 [Methanoregula sp.]